MVKTFLVHVTESESERLFTFETEQQTLTFIGKVIVGQHPANIECIYEADTAAGTITEYGVTLDGYTLKLEPSAV